MRTTFWWTLGAVAVVVGLLFLTTTRHVGVETAGTPPPAPTGAPRAPVPPATLEGRQAPPMQHATPARSHVPMPYPAATPMPGFPGAQVTPELAEGRRRAPEFNTEAYDRIVDNPFLDVGRNPLSTFSIDVDTASYANVRRFLRSGQLPPKDAVRVEELVNYFGYDYPQPAGDAPFSITTELAGCPWQPAHRLALIGLQGRRLDAESLPPRNLVFLLDVSGSMQDAAKLPLVKQSMGLLIDTLTERDRIAIVVYAGAAGLVLPPTPGSAQGTIRAALAELEAGGSTAGGEGIRLAYRVAQDAFISTNGGVNRVILATDGDFNVGVSSPGELERLIEEKRKTGVSLSVLGFGMGNYKDSSLEKLADKGNGNYAYIDTLAEARKVLVQESGGTLVTIAKDVKIQVEFNPRKVAAYRLIGYENRMLRSEDFNDDKKDAGEIGAGHSVTALYEIVPVGVKPPTRRVDPLKYQETPAVSAVADSDELMTVKLRYKQPDGDTSRLLSVAMNDRTQPASSNLKFSAAVAAFGMLLRDSEHKGRATYAQVLGLAREAGGRDPHGYRAEFQEIVRRARELSRDARGE